jgi:hypothetical protein
MDPHAGAPAAPGSILLRSFSKTILMPILALFAGCEARTVGSKSVSEWQVQAGSTVRSFLPEAGDTAVVLVYAPSDCFSCDAALAGWTRLSRDRGWQMHLFLTAAPSNGERDQLRLFRLDPAGVLRNAGTRSTLGTPRVYRFDGEVLIDSAVGSASQQVLLSRVTRESSAPGAAPRQ